MSVERPITVYQPEDVVDIPPSDMPVVVQAELLERANNLSGLITIENLHDFQRLMRLGSLGGYCVFFAQYETVTPTSASTSSRGVNISLADVSDEGSIVGVGDILYKPQTADSPPYDPVVGNILTKEPNKGRGYGTQRYLAMNAVSLLVFGKPLTSRPAGNFRTPSATRRWEDFVRRGLAEAYETVDESGAIFQRYRFRVT